MVHDPVGTAIQEAALQSPKKANPQRGAPTSSRSRKTLRPPATHNKTRSPAPRRNLSAHAREIDVSAESRISHLPSSTYHDPSSQEKKNNIPLEAVLAASVQRCTANVSVLQFCVQQQQQLGASLEDKNISRALECTARSAGVLHFLYRQKLGKGMRTSLVLRLIAWRSGARKTTREELRWFLDHGPDIDRGMIRRAVQGPSAPKAACVEVLLGRYGVAMFRRTNVLQNAAKRGQNDVVRLLLNAGVDVDEMVARSSYDEGEVEATALYDAAYQQHLDTVTLLLEHGAVLRNKPAMKG